MGSLGERRRALMAAAKKSRLPAEYQEVEWIGASGSQRIIPNLPVSGANALKTEGWKATATIQDNGQGNTSGGVFACQQNVGTWFGVYGKAINSLPSASTVNKVTATATWGSENLTISSGTESTSFTYKIVTPPSRFSIFAIPTGVETFDFYAKVKLFALTIWKGGEIVADFIPCYNKKTGEIGLYDVVRNEFFGNAGSGTFTKGPDVT